MTRHFIGEIEQVPPMYSALKRDGRPLYEYARAGVTLERAPRRVTIHQLDLIDFTLDEGAPPGAPGSLRAVLRVACSKGTYIRTLAEDLGKRLGCGAHLSGLRRERVGPLGLAGAVTLAQLEAMTLGQRQALLAPVDSLLAGLPVVTLDDVHARRFMHGQRLRIAGGTRGPAHGAHSTVIHPPDSPGHERPPDQADRRVRVYLRERLLGVATLEDGLLVPHRLIGAIPDPDPATPDIA